MLIFRLFWDKSTVFRAVRGDMNASSQWTQPQRFVFVQISAQIWIQITLVFLTRVSFCVSCQYFLVECVRHVSSLSLWRSSLFVFFYTKALLSTSSSFFRAFPLCADPLLVNLWRVTLLSLGLFHFYLFNSDLLFVSQAQSSSINTNSSNIT